MDETAHWIRIKNHFPRCSNCGYYWIETVIGPVGEGRSNLEDANFCPSCGMKIHGVEVKK